MPNGNDREDCPHEDSIIVMREGWFEERCATCGKMLDRWEVDKDTGDPRYPKGPA